MDIALLVGLIILLAMAVAGISLTYSYYIYTKNKLFTKIKFPVLLVAIISVLLICLLIFVILVAQNLHSKPNPYFVGYLGLGITLLIFSFGYLITFICIYFLNNKNKIDYLEIPNIDWRQKEIELQNNYSDIDSIKKTLEHKKSKYYSEMTSYFQTIVVKAQQKDIQVSELIADIVTFNDVFTNKWSSKLNAYQLQLTYKFCMIFNKNNSQK